MDQFEAVTEQIQSNDANIRKSAQDMLKTYKTPQQVQFLRQVLESSVKPNAQFYATDSLRDLIQSDHWQWIEYFITFVDGRLLAHHVRSCILALISELAKASFPNNIASVIQSLAAGNESQQKLCASLSSALVVEFSNSSSRVVMPTAAYIALRQEFQVVLY